MIEPHAAAPPQPTPADAEALRGLLINGRALDAFAEASRFSPFETWTHPRARRVATWLCELLGAPKRGRALDLGTYRRAPRSPMGRIVRLHLVHAARGPLEAWRALRAEGPLGEEATDEERAELLLLEGHLLARFRDFERATAATQRAAERGASLRRVMLYQARILVERDRHREALDAALRARDAAPHNADVIALLALIHLLLGDADEALAILRAGAAQTQSADLAMQLIGLLEERKLVDERREWIERWAERVPLLERPEDLTNLRADSAFERGDLPAALELLRRDTSTLSAKLAARLALRMGDLDAKRVLLDVPFVRQHHMTCAPATLTALAGYWQMGACHLEVAEAICYDGTPSHSQRAWAEENGFAVREMTVTWDVARALLDRGVPFTVAIVEGASAHLQAIVGYDERRGTLLLRDPFIPRRLEVLAEEWLETWRATGPHGMVLVPIGREGRLDGIAFPDAPLYNELHRLHVALGKHDRDAAEAACRALIATAPAHRLAISARRALAAYDQDAEGVLACAREAAALFPDFVAAELDALNCMRAVRSRDDRIAAASELRRAHPKEPLYAEALALTLADDAREHPVATRLLRLSLRARPDRHGPVALVADIAWDARSFEEALSIRRFAACLGRFDETAAMAYFFAARALGREDEALALLEARAAELGALDVGPVATFFRALEAMGRTDEGLEVVEAALARRPDDGERMLLAAELRGAVGDLEAARALLMRAQGVAKQTAWLRGAARLALRAGTFPERKAWLEQLLAREPLDVESHASYASAIAATEGPAAARSYLERAWERTPHLRALARQYLGWLHGAGAAATERAARKILAIDPADDWTNRELAIALVDQGRTDEAREVLAVAAAVAPSDASLECSRAWLFRREGRRAEARAALLAAIEIDPDRSHAIGELLSESDDRDRTLGEIEKIVHARSVTGAGIVAWYTVARTARAPEALARTLDHLRAGRPNHPATWTTSIGHRSFMGDHAASLALAGEACARFPLVSAVWTARADALLAAHKNDEALAAIEHAARLDSLSEATVSRLAKARLRSGDTAGAKDALVRAIGRLPTSSALRVQLAELAWGLGDRAKALAEVELVLALEADHEHAWKMLDDWSTAGADRADERGERRGDDVLARIQSLCVERPWSAHAALNLARAKARHDDIDGALAALDRATELDPLLADAHDFRAVVLAFLGRFDEAKTATAPPALAGASPRELRGRAAWVLARQGDLDGACRAMRALLEEHADYAWGWGELARWERQRGAPDSCLAAAKRLVAASPSLPACHRVLASALFETGDRAGAKKALAHAVDLAPNDEETLLALFDALLEEDDLDAPVATALIPLLRAARPAAALSADARLSARRDDADRAIDALRALAVEPDAAAGFIADAHRACVFAGLADRCESLLASLLKEEAAHPSIGEIWVRGRLGDNDLVGVAKAMGSLDPKRPAIRAAASTWLSLLRERGEGDEAREAARLVKGRFAPCDDGLWADVAGSLLNGACAECVSWTADWRARPNATSWMLFNVASALREVGREDEAFEVVQKAAHLTPDGATRSHKTWLAFELALRGEHAEARRWLDDAGDLQRVPILGTVSTLTRATLVAQEAGRGTSSFGHARALLSSARAELRHAVLVRAHERALQRVVSDAGFLGTLWTHRSALWACAVLGAVALLILVSASGGGLSTGDVSSSLPSLSPALIGLLIFALRAAARGGRKT